LSESTADLLSVKPHLLAKSRLSEKSYPCNTDINFLRLLSKKSAWELLQTPEIQLNNYLENSKRRASVTFNGYLFWSGSISQVKVD